MKKLLFTLLFFMAANAFAASATLTNGENIEQYNISDPGNVSGFDGYVLYYSRGIPEVVIEVNTTTHRVIKESFGCEEDPDIVECPTDDIGGGVLRSPVINFLGEIQSQNSVTQIQTPLTAAAERLIYLAFWHAYKAKVLVTQSIDEMVTEGLNALQQKRALKYIYFGNGVDIVTSKTLADARIDNGTVARYDDYGFTNIPQKDRRLIKLFGLAGWFL